MRSLIVTIVLCCVMFLAAATNFVYVNRLADAMNEILDAIPSIDDPMSVQKADELCKKWEKNSPIVGLSVGFLTVDKLTEYCQTLRSCAEVGDVYGYYTALTLIRDSINDIKRLEKISIENLF